MTCVVEAETLSQAWRDTVQRVAAAPDRKMFHTFTTMRRPLEEVPSIRASCDGLLESMGLDPVHTVAGTTFPAAIAANTASPALLVHRYRCMYRRLRRFDGNQRGTYFGRIVAYTVGDTYIDQLVARS